MNRNRDQPPSSKLVDLFVFKKNPELKERLEGKQKAKIQPGGDRLGEG